MIKTARENSFFLCELAADIAPELDRFVKASHNDTGVFLGDIEAIQASLPGAAHTVVECARTLWNGSSNVSLMDIATLPMDLRAAVITSLAEVWG